MSCISFHGRVQRVLPCFTALQCFIGGWILKQSPLDKCSYFILLFHIVVRCISLCLCDFVFLPVYLRDSFPELAFLDQSNKCMYISCQVLPKSALQQWYCFAFLHAMWVLVFPCPTNIYCQTFTFWLIGYRRNGNLVYFKFGQQD